MSGNGDRVLPDHGGGSESADWPVFELIRTHGSLAPGPPICADVRSSPGRPTAVQIQMFCTRGGRTRIP